MHSWCRSKQWLHRCPALSRYFLRHRQKDRCPHSDAGTAAWTPTPVLLGFLSLPSLDTYGPIALSHTKTALHPLSLAPPRPMPGRSSGPNHPGYSKPWHRHNLRAAPWSSDRLLKSHSAGHCTAPRSTGSVSVALPACCKPRHSGPYCSSFLFRNISLARRPMFLWGTSRWEACARRRRSSVSKPAR